MQLTETYRPRSWADVVGQDKAVAKLQRLKSYGGRAYWISGQSGTGKTTIARLIAQEVAPRDQIRSIDADSLNVDTLEKWTAQAYAGRSLFGGYAFLVNEAHGLRQTLIRRLLETLEPIPEWCAWIFTTTIEGQEKLFGDCDDTSPLLSRCFPVPLARRDLCKPFAERLHAIALENGLDGIPMDRYVANLKKNRNNLRMSIQDLEAGVI